MLQHMFLGDPPGNYDRILDFSTAVTGASSSCRRPTSSTTAPLPGVAEQPGGDGSDAAGAPVPGDAADGSLGIGGLGHRPG